MIPVTRVTPDYPFAALNLGIDGLRCSVRAHVDAAGVPTYVSNRGCPDPFYAAAALAARGWRFTWADAPPDAPPADAPATDAPATDAPPAGAEAIYDLTFVFHLPPPEAPPPHVLLLAEPGTAAAPAPADRSSGASVVLTESGGPCHEGRDPDAPVEATYRVIPAFPREATAQGITRADCALRLHLDYEGIVSSIEPADCAEPFLAPARQAAAQWQFTPSFADGHRCAAVYDLTLRFVGPPLGPAEQRRADRRADRSR